MTGAVKYAREPDVSIVALSVSGRNVAPLFVKVA